ncbi:Glycerol-3-phosphate dehydrogenase [NAD(+)], cytoplasmic [Nymphon striatum]|nr:Glycerol-3-phosphate dehydrogenase [NAD(+)], cytoplasmic [Nymphon striatum]
MSSPKKVSIIGSGNWGSAIAKIIGSNAAKLPSFENEVKMWAFEEMIDGKKLTEIINEKHENVKYLPGHKLPSNVVAIPDLIECSKDADILVFVLPHQFMEGVLKQMIGKVKESVVALSLIKGFDMSVPGKLELISNRIKDKLNIKNMSVLMGANLAKEVAEEKFCETTIGCPDKEIGQTLKDLIQTPYFRVVVVDDVSTVEICGALKNIVACGAGFVDGLNYGDNTKAAIIRLGLMEIMKFTEIFYPGCKLSTFFESCGIADLVTTCYGGRNRKVSAAFAKTGKKMEDLEKEMLNGQRLQGPETAAVVYEMLISKGIEKRFPLFTAIHKICIGEIPPSDMIDCVRSHPEHM